MSKYSMDIYTKMFYKHEIPGVFSFANVIFSDDRGAFFRQYEKDVINNFVPDYTAASINKKSGTWRGMHYQLSPHSEKKLVSVVHGSITDVVLDMRVSSPTYRKHIKLDMKPGLNLYIPEGCAHGFLTNEDNTVVQYSISGKYEPSSYRGIRWNDPFFKLDIEPTTISKQDAEWRDFDPMYHHGLIASGPPFNVAG